MSSHHHPHSFLSCLLLCAVTLSSAQTVTTLASFNGLNGNDPGEVVLIQGFDGALYGTTRYGGSTAVGTRCRLRLGCGTVFKITTDGTLTTLHSFCADPHCSDGQLPQAGLVLSRHGDLYGTTSTGKTGDCDGGCGTIFKITPEGVLTTMHTFDQTDGDNPSGALIQASNGNFYGTTQGGGSNCCGTVFEMTPSGVLTTLYNFSGPDGNAPIGTLVQAASGFIYGTTFVGGASTNCNAGCGTVFRISPAGALTTIYNFCMQSNCPDGGLPYSGLIQAANGGLYGTTEQGGANGAGTVFEISPSGVLHQLHSFCSTKNQQNYCADGYIPIAGLMQASSGKFYGTTELGGADNQGTIFQISAGGRLIKLHNFTGADGSDPWGPPVQATNGNFYGTTSTSTRCTGCGTIYTFSLGLAPFIQTNPVSGQIGSSVVILGYHLTGSTAVSFNGTSATTFTVVSDTEITATVPAGATSGNVEVTTPNTTLTSNHPYVVQP